MNCAYLKLKKELYESLQTCTIIECPFSHRNTFCRSMTFAHVSCVCDQVVLSKHSAVGDISTNWVEHM